jgi:hypothetical protein
MSLSRRSLIREASALTLIASEPSASDADTSPVPFNRHIDCLLQYRSGLLVKRDALDQRWLEAYRRLPDWSKPGPKLLDQDGIGFGPHVGWPSTETEQIQLPDGLLLVRPSPADLSALYVAHSTSHGRQRAAQQYRMRSRQADPETACQTKMSTGARYANLA